MATISNANNNTIITGTSMGDVIYDEGDYVTIYGNEGNDTINIINGYNKSKLIFGNAGNDVISLDGYGSQGNITIDGGIGDDTVYADSDIFVYQYAKGDGNDIIYCPNSWYNELFITEGVYTKSFKGNDIIVQVDSGSITFKDAHSVRVSGNDGGIINGTSDTDEDMSNSGNKVTINALGGDDEIWNSGDSVVVYAGEGNDSIDNTGRYTTIDAGAGNDTITNLSYFYYNGSTWKYYGDYVSISGGWGDDVVSLSGPAEGMTVNGGKGNDTIYFSGEEKAIYQYARGDGSDIIYNFTDNDTLEMSNEIYTTALQGGNFIIKLADGDITFKDSEAVRIKHNDSIVIYGLAEGTYINNTKYAAVINHVSGGIFTSNSSKEVSINGSSESDYIENYGDRTTINANAGDDSIGNNAEYALVNGGNGNDTIHNTANTTRTTINGGAGNDSIYNSGNNITIDGGSGNDTIINSNYWLHYSDYDYYYGRYVSISGGAGNDFISLNGGGGNGGDTVNGGTGNDTIIAGYEMLYQYTAGDGNDTIIGYKFNDTISISGAKYSTVKSGSDLKISVGTGSILLKDAANLSVNIVGTSSGGTSTTPADTTPADTLPVGISIKNSILTASTKFTGTSINLATYPTATKVNAAALSKGISIIGSAANNSLKGGKGADTISGGSGNDTLTGGAGKDIFIYSGGNDIITDYKAGEDKISVNYTSSTVKGSDVILTTANGNITIQKAKDKVITFADGGEKIFFSDTSYAPLATGLKYDAKRTVLTASNKFTGNKIDLSDYLSSVTKVNASALSKGISIVGSAANNSLKGGKGADTISGGSGNDTLTGGAGKDLFIYSSGEDIITDYKPGEDKISVNYSSSTVKGSDVILTTANGNITIQKAKDKVITFADGGDKIFYGNTSYAPLATGLKYDAKRIMLTADKKFTGSTIDLKNYLSSVTKINAAALSKSLNLVGNDLNNSIKGGSGADTISAGAGNDTVYGGAGNDKIYGDAGNDKLCGDAGNDSLYGGAGNDTFTGGKGADTFIYSAGKDVITDYAAEDTIQISGTISKTTYSGKNIVFTIGNGTLTVQNGKGKNITVTDSSGTKTYSKTFDLLEDNNFITDEPQLSDITAQKFSVTEIQNTKDELNQMKTLLTFAKK